MLHVSVETNDQYLNARTAVTLLIFAGILLALNTIFHLDIGMPLFDNYYKTLSTIDNDQLSCRYLVMIKDCDILIYFWQDSSHQMNSYGVNKVTAVHPEGEMNAGTKFQGNSFCSCLHFKTTNASLMVTLEQKSKITNDIKIHFLGTMNIHKKFAWNQDV